MRDLIIEEYEKALNTIIQLVENGYTLVQFPDVQKYMDEDWFEDEAYLANDNLDEIGYTAYFIPNKRL